MSEIKIHLDDLYSHQQDVLTALDIYPWQGGVNQSYNIEHLDPDHPEILAALIWIATAGGKTRTLLARAFIQWARSSHDARKIVLLIGHTDATVQRFDDEYQKVQTPPSGIAPLVTGLNIPLRILTLTGKSAGIEFGGLRAGGVAAMSVGYALNRIDETLHKRAIKDTEWLNDVIAVHIDEGAHYAAKTWRKIAAAFPNAEISYWSGSPIREDKQRLPGVPYRVTQGRVTGTIEYELIDLAEMTGIPGARYPLAAAVRDGRVKRISHDDTKHLTESPDPKSQDGMLAGKSLQDLKSKAKREGYRFIAFTNDDAIYKLLEHAFVSFNEISESYRLDGIKWTAIAKAASKSDADRIGRLARQVGWNALVYYCPSADDENSEEPVIPSDEMKLNLRRFEDPSSPINLLVQVNRLTEGYDNSAIFMAIMASPVWSSVAFDQFAGRILRLVAGKEPKELPPAMIHTLNIEPNRNLLENYCDTATDLTFVVDPTPPPPPPPGPSTPKLDWSAETWLLGDGLTWRQIAEAYDPLDKYKGMVFPEKWDEFKAVFPAAKTSGSNPVPENWDDALTKIDEIRTNLRGFLMNNGQQFMQHMEHRARPGHVGIVVNTVIGELYPGLRGGKKNRNADPRALAELIAQYDAEPNVIKVACFEKLKNWR